MNLRLAGILLFLPVPIVLALFTRLPLGVPASLGIGVVLMATHRLYARPFALRKAAARCLWCGCAVNNGPSLQVREPVGITQWRTCSDRHADNLRRVLGWAQRRQVPLKVGILGGLALFLPAALVRPEDAVAVFQLAVALSVLPLGWLGPRGEPSADDPLPSPFPVHVPALIGTVAVVWLFRLVGLAWLVKALIHLGGRLTA